jgi:NAD(P)-dependent dehydrogenase (short-subunit alcohol dehydrogenase family)
MPSLRLDGRVALVTGGSRGLGLGIALALAHAGADIGIVGRSDATLEDAAALIRGTGHAGLAIRADLADNDAPAAVVRQALDHFGRLDILVHAAGVNIRQPATAFTLSQWATVMRLNVEAAFFLALAAEPTMRAQAHGRIICVTSIAAGLAIPNTSVYGMSKAALQQMVRALALEWAPHGITVNALAPGRFWTAMTDAVFSNARAHASAVSVIPAGRPGVPADLAGAAVLLASDASAYVTGQAITVDGGWTASGGVLA